jgi:hypothetical protein
MSFPYIIQGDNIVVVIGNKVHTVSKTHVTYPNLLQAIKDCDWDRVEDLVDPKEVIVNFGRGNVSIQGSKLFWKGQELHNALTTKMIRMLQEGFSIEPLVHFMDNLMQNPSKRAVDELYGFLEKGNLPITPDGHFLAYKKVRDDYLDVYTGTIDNSVGEIVEMGRNGVDDDKDRTCSSGLHFCSQEYLASFGGDRVMILKINPRDVVSIPSDYNNTKGRCCRYEVIGEIEGDETTTFVRSVQSNGDGLETDDDFTEDDFSDWDDDFEEYTDQDTDSAAWPFKQVDEEEEPEQEYDSRGRPLSMTKDAIRKRRQRAARRAAGLSS